MKKDTSVAITTFPTDGSLPPQHMTDGGLTKDRQEKCLALHRRKEAYKFFFADISLLVRVDIGSLFVEPKKY